MTSVLELAFIGLLAPPTPAIVRSDQLFASWEQAERIVKSLVVEFRLEIKDRVFREAQNLHGFFRLVRTEKGEILASYEVSENVPNVSKTRWPQALLNNWKIYLLDHDSKTAFRVPQAEKDLQGFLEETFNPLVVLLDRKRAQEKCSLKIAQQDSWYTYLEITPKNQDAIPSFKAGRIVLQNSATASVPKDMPRQWGSTDGFQQKTFEIKSWRINSPDAPKAEEFARPEDLPGWQVREWTWPSVFKQKKKSEPTVPGKAPTAF